MVTRKRIKTIFLLRRGTAAEWAQVNPVLEQGEPGFAYDTKEFKIGDGITPWNDLGMANQDEFNEIISRIDNLRVIDLVDGADYATKQYVDSKFDVIDCGTSTTVL